MGEQIKMSTVATRREKATLTGHGQQVMTVAFAPDGKTLVSVSQDLTVKR